MRIQRTVWGSGWRSKNFPLRTCSARDDLRRQACEFCKRIMRELTPDFPVTLAARENLTGIYFYLPLSQVPAVVKNGFRTFAQYFRNRLPEQRLAPSLRCPVIPVKDKEGAKTIGFLLACCFKTEDYTLEDSDTLREVLEGYYRQNVLPFYRKQHASDVFPLWAC